MNLGDADYRRISRIYGSADDGLQGSNQLSRRNNGVIAQMRHRRMGCLPGKGDFKTIKRGHHGTCFNGKMTCRNIRKIVHTKNAICRKLFK